ncbi:MAG TPA: methyltransferase domain-containing protein [Bryobacteraceae bacterium]|nr:methyltransferase domain-containing protein [Bryobacteraceae bacterium]
MKQMINAGEQSALPSTSGIIIHRAFLYDLFLRVVSLGRERAYRQKALDLASLKTGDSVLDIGCGTGTLAIAARQRVGPSGRVYGVDASPEMLARAGKKASKAGAEVVFKNAVVEALPFPDSQFDAVLSTVMLHHLGRKARQQCAHEVRRVLKPGGRVLAVDFARPAKGKRGLLDHFHHHGYVDLNDLVALFTEAGLKTVRNGALGIGDLQFVLASVPTARDHVHCE